MARAVPLESGLPWFVARVAEYAPATRALIHGDVVISYGELHALSNELSEALILSGCLAGDRVATFLPHSAAAIVALLGIQKAGCIAVPLAFGNSAETLLSLIDFCQCEILLAFPGQASAISNLEDSSLAVDLGQQGQSTVMGITMLPVTTTGHRITVPKGDTIAEFLMHDQGGGSPKPVVVGHHNIAALADWTVSDLNIVPTDRICGANPLHTGLSLFDMAAAFCAGAELHIPPSDSENNPRTLIRWLQQDEISIWLAPSSALQRMVNADLISSLRFDSLRQLLWWGEILPVRVLMQLMDRLEHAEFINVYGQLETGIAAGAYRVPVRPRAADMAVPVGTAVGGMKVEVLDDALQPVEQGDVGRICVSGPGVVSGYWQETAATQNAFRVDADGRRWFLTGDMGYVGYDGMLYLVGRISHRLRRAGRDVFISAIEHALGCLDYVNDAVVVTLPNDSAEDQELACAYVQAGRGYIQRTGKRLQRDLRALLPDYMVPEHWLEFNDLPHTSRGKLDRSLISHMIYKSKCYGSKASIH